MDTDNPGRDCDVNNFSDNEMCNVTKEPERKLQESL